MAFGQCIIVVGTTGSGKSTLAAQLADLLSAPHIELDSLVWKENWTYSSDEDFIQSVQNAVERAGDKWIVDGNYSRTRDLTWPLADTVIWLDYPLYIIYWRLFWRTLRRTVYKEELWNGNRERFWTQFLSKESLFVWAHQSHQRRRKIYETIMTENQYPDLRFYRFKHPRETERWLKQLRVNQ